MIYDSARVRRVIWTFATLLAPNGEFVNIFEKDWQTSSRLHRIGTRNLSYNIYLLYRTTFIFFSRYWSPRIGSLEPITKFYKISNALFTIVLTIRYISLIFQSSLLSSTLIFSIQLNFQKVPFHISCRLPIFHVAKFIAQSSWNKISNWQRKGVSFWTSFLKSKADVSVPMPRFPFNG